MIDYEKSLNAAQFQAATAVDGPVLVIAGAGSGKTRTIVYRLAWLAERGVWPSSMLLLTFTRKAAQEMLHRAGLLLRHESADAALSNGANLQHVQGGTFHGFAFQALRQYRPAWLEGRNFTVMDSADISAAVRHCKDELKLGKGDRSFPKTQTIVGLLSKARNKEIPLEDVLRRESFHLLPHLDALQQLDRAYTDYRRTQGLLDYDDLLFELEAFLRENGPGAQNLRRRFHYLMVDEYQDTNLVQARIVHLLGQAHEEGGGNVMAVGDDAQSIYAFRGANVRNILDFPNNFPGTRIVRLEENYRSTQPVLQVANALLDGADEAFKKTLFTKREGGEPVRVITPINDRSQAEVLVRRIRELLREHLPHEIAVLFRAGFHSYHLEVALQRAGIAFRKYGGLRYTEAAHVKDVLAYARLCLNPLDMPAFERVAALHHGIGPRTVQKLYATATAGNAAATEKAFAKFPSFLADMRFLDEQRLRPATPPDRLQAIIEHYQPLLEQTYPDDWPRRRQGLDEIVQMAAAYQDLDLFVADLALESPEEDEHEEGRITLSTIHSAKGLEWNAVLLLDLVEDRFPSRHALASPEDFEEERRLMYVACTRARRHLDLYTPASVYSRSAGGAVFATPSPFVRDLPRGLCEEWLEGYGGVLNKRGSGHGSQGSDFSSQSAQGYARPPARLLPPPCQPGQPGQTDQTAQARAEEPAFAVPAADSPRPLGHCHHKIFGRGKMVKFLPPDKYQVNFPGFGLKVILEDFLTPENTA